MGGFTVIVLAACVLVSSFGVSSGFVFLPGFGFPQPVNAFRQASEIQNFVHNQIKSMTPFAGGFPVGTGTGVQFFNTGGGGGVVSTAGAGAGGGILSTGGGTGGTVVSTSTGGGTGGFVSTLGGGGNRFGGGSTTFFSSGGPNGGFEVIQTASDLDGKQTGQILINENGKITAYELPSGAGTVFTVHSDQSGSDAAASSDSATPSNAEGEKVKEGGAVEDDGKGGTVVSSGSGGGVVSTSTGGGTGGFVSTVGGGGTRYGGGSSSFVSSGGPGGGFGVIQTASNLDGKQSSQVLINDNGKVTAFEVPAGEGGGTVFTVHSSQGGPGVASSTYSSSYKSADD